MSAKAKLHCLFGLPQETGPFHVGIGKDLDDFGRDWSRLTRTLDL